MGLPVDWMENIFFKHDPSEEISGLFLFEPGTTI